ncbi:MAG: ActS/PrrB/RegB family redox-sensitive histidine kinase [Candidatus Puniceispirillaceae bacterium]
MPKQAPLPDPLSSASPPASVAASLDVTNDWHLTSLRKGPFDPQNLVKIRWLALAGQLLACLVIHFGFGFPVPIVAALGVIVTSAFVNLAIDQRNRHVTLVHPFEVMMALSFDVLQLAGLIYLTGGLLNPFFILLLAPIVVSAAILELRATLFLVMLVIICASLLSVYHMPLPWQDSQFEVPQLFLFGILVALIISALFIAFYTWYLANNTRELANSLNKARLRLASEREGLALGRLATAAAHKLGSPLNTISLISHDLLHELAQDDPQLEDIQLLNREVERCRIILQELDKDANLPSDRIAFALPAGEVVQSLTEAKIREMAHKVNWHISGKQGVDEPVMYGRPELKYALETILDNADGFAQSEIQFAIDWDEDTLILRIDDDGLGFKQSILNRFGRPFNSSRKGRDGHRGLGLYLAMSLIEHSGGKMSIENLPFGGGRVAISIPRSYI